MSEPSPRFGAIFFDLYEGLPRRGPAHRACAAKALGLCRDLSPTPALLDLGCGVRGGKPSHLAGLLPGALITALGSHAPSEVLAANERWSFSLIDHFTLPDEAWWGDFSTPMERRIEELRTECAADVDALAVLDQLAQEPDMHRRHSDCYAYEFSVVRRDG